MSDFTNGEGLDSVLDGDALDLEIQQNEEGLAELLDGGNAKGELRRNVQTGDLAVLRGGVTQPEVVVKASSVWDHDSELTRESDRLYNELEADMAAATVTAVRETPQNSQALVSDMTDGMATISDLRSSATAVELAVIQRAAEVPLATAARESAAFNIAARNELVRMLDEQNLMDRVLDVAGLFVPARTTLEWEDVKDGVNSDKQLSRFLTGDSIAQMITSFQSLPLARKQAIYPALSELVFKASGIDGLATGGHKLTEQNMVLGASMLMRFLDPEGGERASHDQKIDLGLEALAFAPAVGKFIKNIDLGGFAKGAKGTGLRPTPPEGPVTQSGLDAISNEVAKLPAPTRKAMESVLLSSGEQAVKEHNIVRVLAVAGDKKGAARMNVAAMSDDEVARAIGITSDEAVQNAMPFQTADWMPQVVDGLLPEMGKALNNFYRQASRQVTDVTTESIRTRIGATHRADRANQVKSFQQEVARVGEDILSDGYTLSDVKITGENTEAFTFQYNVTDNTGAQRVLSGRRTWSAGRVKGDYSATAEDIMKTSVSSLPGQSPASWSVTKPDGTDFNDTVKLSIQVEDLTVAIRSDVASLWIDANDAVTGLTGKGQRQQLNALDIEGDEYVNPETQEAGKVFLPQELTAKGITDPAIIEAYYKRRLVADAMHAMQNYTVRRELELTGFKRSVIIGQGEDAAQLFVKPYEDVQAAKSALREKADYNIFDPASNKTFNASDTHIDRIYDSGRMIVRSHEDWNTSGNDLDRGAEHVEYIAVQRVDVQGLPEQVIHYKAGYVPKANEGIEFVVQRNFPVMKRGAPATSKQEAMRAFASKQDAEIFRATQVANHADRMGISLEAAENLYVIADGSAMTQIDRATNSLSGSKGLFRGTRAKDDLLMGLEGKALERMQPEDVIGRWLDHVATNITKNEMRIGKEQEWLNTVRRISPNTELRGFDGTILANDEAGQALEKLRGQLRAWNTTQSRSESLFEAAAQRTHDWVLNGKRSLGISSDAVDSILWLKHSDPFAAAKTANMHVLLGTMNPAQLYVQASAMTVALSLSPVRELGNVVARVINFTVMDNVRSPTALGKLLRMDKRGYDTPQEFEEVYIAWQRSGLRESVRGNADLNYTSSTGIGMANDTLRKAGNVSLMVYRAGELINRRTSYIVAFNQWRKTNPTAKIDDAAESDILRQANLMMLELNGANRAWWQGGAGADSAQKVAALGTQFMQVMSKTVELSAKGTQRGGFTREQKGRIALGQLVAFGAAGVPLISMVGPALVNWVADKINDDPSSPEGVELRETLANSFNQGFVGVLTREMMGAEVDVANRASLGLGVFTTIEDILTSEDPVWSRLLGVTGETGKRVATATEQLSLLGQSSNMFRAMQSIEPLLLGQRAQSEDLSLTEVMTTMQDIAVILAGIPSTGRNAMKARIMATQNEIYSRRGQVRIRDDFSFGTMAMVALGFQPSAESRLRALEGRKFDNKDHMNDAVESMLRMYHRYIYAHNRSPEYGQSVVRAKQVIEESFNNPVLVQDFNTRLESRILRVQETAEDRALNEFFRTTLKDEVSAGYIMDQERAFDPSKALSNSPVIVPFQDVQSAPKVED